MTIFKIAVSWYRVFFSDVRKLKETSKYELTAVEKQQKGINKPKRNKGVQDWERLRKITNSKIEKFRFKMQHS